MGLTASVTTVILLLNATEVRDRIGDRIVVASISGGKDSAAMSLYLTELGVEHRRVFADTGWEHPATYEYLRGPLAAKLGPIDEVRGPLGMADLIRHKGMFPARIKRFCTEHLKVKPLQAYFAALPPDRDYVNAIGIRRAESVARASTPEWEWSEPFDCELWRPLVEWTEQDVIAMHRRHGLRPNPLYLMGARRVGCWPCIFASKSEIALVAQRDPDRIAAIHALEVEINVRRAGTFAARGEVPRYPATFFTLRPDGKTHVGSPIEDVVAWARSNSPEIPGLVDDGCMRWGLCETGE